MSDTTPRTAEISKVSQITLAQKAKHPCMFYAFNVCKAKQCPFLHEPNNKYSGPPPRSLDKPKDGPPKTTAALLSKGCRGAGWGNTSLWKSCLCPVYRPTTCVYRLSAAAPLPSALHDGVASVVPAMTASAVRHRLWGTAAGRHLFGKQAMTPAMKKRIRACVIFHGGVGSPMNLGCIKHIAGALHKYTVHSANGQPLNSWGWPINSRKIKV